jgi:[histone H3]-lysine4 N-trimethyltransferase ASH1L
MVSQCNCKLIIDYNFSWFEGAKEQKCKCSATNCRGFIGKRRALLSTSKPEIIKTTLSSSSLRQVLNGRITKATPKTIKAHPRIGKVDGVKTSLANTKRKMSKGIVKKSSIKSKIFSEFREESALGKRKRERSSSSPRISSSRSRSKTTASKIANARQKRRGNENVNTLNPSGRRALEIVSRSRRRNAR